MEKAQARPAPNQPDNPDSQPSVRVERLAVARAASAVGALGLILAVFSFLLLGDLGLFTLIGVVVGVVGLAGWMILAPEDLRTTLGGRRTVHGTNSLLVSILFAGVMALAYVVAVTASVAVDLTGVGFYTLKPDVRPIVVGLSRPVQITAFYSRALLGQQSADEPVLRMFADAAPENVRLVFADPDEQPVLAGEFGLRSNFGIFISYLTAEGKPDTRQNATVQARGSLANEMFIAEAILQLSARGKFRVAFAAGAGEVNLDTDATGIRDGLRDKGIEVVTLDLANQDVPEGTTALVILSPRADYSRDAVARIERYLAGGGKLLLMANPAFEGAIRFMTTPESPLAVYLWDVWGVKPQRDIVFDPVSYYLSAYYVRPATYNEQSPVVYKDQQAIAQPLFMLSQSWELNTTPPPNVSLARLYVTSDQAFGKTQLAEIAQNPDRWKPEAGDIPGPLILAATAENTANGARLIVVGDSGWVRDDSILSFDGSFLWTNMIDWLTQFVEQVTVRPTIGQFPLNVGANDLNLVALLTLVALPGLVLLAGGVVWWRRNRR